jgi:hypothetical protein
MAGCGSPSTPSGAWCSSWARSVHLVQAIRLGGRGRIALAALGFVGMLGAGFNGGSFLNYHQDFSSLLMSIGFALTMSAYIALLYSTPAPSTARA